MDAISKEAVLERVHVNVPFCMLYGQYMDYVTENRINPEIGLDARALEGTDLDTFKACAETLSASGLSVSFHGPFVDLSPGSIDSDIRAVTRRRFQQLLPMVQMFHPTTVVCHTGYDPFRHGYMRNEWLTNSIEIWSWFAEALKNEGALLVIENVFEEGPDDMLPLFEALAPNGVRLCFDVGHQLAFSKTSLPKWIEVLGSHIGQLHLHDNKGDFDSHLPLGRGKVDLKNLFKFLKTRGEEDLHITLEPHVDSDLWPSIDYLTANWPWG